MIPERFLEKKERTKKKMKRKKKVFFCCLVLLEIDCHLSFVVVWFLFLLFSSIQSLSPFKHPKRRSIPIKKKPTMKRKMKRKERKKMKKIGDEDEPISSLSNPFIFQKITQEKGREKRKERER